MADWDRFFRIVQESDPYQHLRSIHNCRGFYDHAKPWVTHRASRARMWNRRAPGASSTASRSWSTSAATRATSPSAGAISRRRRWCGASGRAPCGAAMSATARPTCIPRTSCGGPKVACCTARARRASPFCDRCWSGARRRDSIPSMAWSQHGFPCAGQAGKYYLVYCGVHQPATMTLIRAAGQ